LLNVAKSMGKWLPADDFLLIQSVTQLNDLQAVCKLTQFSRKFTLKEVKERWFAILYDSKISRLV
jgi:predicted nucleic acid-binding protein